MAQPVSVSYPVRFCPVLLADAKEAKPLGMAPHVIRKDGIPEDPSHENPSGIRSAKHPCACQGQLRVAEQPGARILLSEVASERGENVSGCSHLWREE